MDLITLRETDTSCAPTCREEAVRLHAAGIATVPILLDRQKKPAVKWKARQTALPTLSTVRADHQEPRALAAVTGEGSGNLEDLDFDDLDLFAPWREVVDRLAPGLVERLVLIKTPHGMAAAYRHQGAPMGNTDLARGLRDFDDNGIVRAGALIQTRGQGGYFLIPPSAGRAHPSGRPYRYMQGDLARVPTITAEERAIMLDAARSLSELPAQEKRVPQPAGGAAKATRAHRPRAAVEPSDELRPGDDFNRRTTWQDLLVPAGWTPLFVTEDGVQYWRRPDKRFGHSATTNHGGTDHLYVFTSSAAPLEADTSYDRFAAYAALHHEGDYSAAARALAVQGFGTLGTYAKEHHGGDLSAAAKDLARQRDDAEKEGRHSSARVLAPPVRPRGVPLPAPERSDGVPLAPPVYGPGIPLEEVMP
jgi:putative DNA primase/helicase